MNRWFHRILSLRSFTTSGTMPFDSWRDPKNKYLESSVEEKRKTYACGSNFKQLDDIPILFPYISALRVDITTLEIDAIVNAANAGLAGGGGVDGAIHRAAGKSLLQDECRSIGGCATGRAVMTGGYKLPARYIIHTVGPIGEKPDLLASCYKESLNLMRQHGLKSIAFPCISTGAYGYPKEPAAKVAIETVRSWIEANVGQVDRVIFCLFDHRDVDIYTKLLNKYFA